MITNSDSKFISFELTEQEYILGHLLNPAQRAVLQNLLAEKAEAKVMLTIDSTNIQSSLQQEAELHGAIRILTYLLEADKQYRSAQASNQNDSY